MGIGRAAKKKSVMMLIPERNVSAEIAYVVLVALTSVEECDIPERCHRIAGCGFANAEVPCCIYRDTLEDDGADTRNSEEHQENCRNNQ